MRTGERLHRIFAERAAAGRKVLVAYLTVGFPSRSQSAELVAAALRAGADVVELGAPFSDPVADGPTIQRAAERALADGFVLEDLFTTATTVRQEHPEAGLVVMGYANPFFRYGIERMAERSAASGIDAWILPDVPFEESERFAAPAARNGVAFVPLVAPTTGPERAERIVAGLRPPFAYYVSVTGVTGARKGFPPGWAEPLEAMRARTRVPFVVGFGISSPALAAEAAAHAEGVVVGSALLDRVGAAADPVAAVAEFVGALREVL